MWSAVLGAVAGDCPDSRVEVHLLPPHRPRFFAPNAGQGVGSVVIAPTYLDVNAGRPARQVQWNLTLQRQVGRNFSVEAGYVANRGVWWEAAALSAANAVSEPLLRSFGFNDFTSATESALLTTTIANLTAAQKANEWDMDGHAAKAKDLLDQVNRELKLAAEAANKHAK